MTRTATRLLAPLLAVGCTLALWVSAGPVRRAPADAAPRPGATLPAPGGSTRPNFLFIVTDDQRWDALGVVHEQGEAARFPWFKTPHLDRLASQGVRFRNAFVVNSLCSPSRACFLTSRYSHLNGVANNRTPFPATAVTH